MRRTIPAPTHGALGGAGCTVHTGTIRDLVSESNQIVVHLFILATIHFDLLESKPTIHGLGMKSGLGNIQHISELNSANTFLSLTGAQPLPRRKTGRQT